MYIYININTYSFLKVGGFSSSPYFMIQSKHLSVISSKFETKCGGKLTLTIF